MVKKKKTKRVSRTKVKERFIDNNKDYIRIGYWGFCLVHYKDRSNHTIFVIEPFYSKYDILKVLRKKRILHIWN